MTVETQRLEGLHGHAMLFGGYITSEKLVLLRIVNLNFNVYYTERLTFHRF